MPPWTVQKHQPESVDHPSQPVNRPECLPLRGIGPYNKGHTIPTRLRTVRQVGHLDHDVGRQPVDHKPSEILEVSGELGTTGTGETGDHQKVTHASMLLPATGEDLSVTGHSTFAEQHQQTGDGRRLSVLVSPGQES